MTSHDLLLCSAVLLVGCRIEGGTAQGRSLALSLTFYAPLSSSSHHRRFKIDSRNNLDRTPLHWAAANGHLGTVKLLIDHGALVEAKDKYGMRALLWAAWFGRKEVFEYLLKEIEVDVKATNKQGSSPYSRWFGRKYCCCCCCSNTYSKYCRIDSRYNCSPA